MARPRRFHIVLAMAREPRIRFADPARPLIARLDLLGIGARAR